MLVPLHRGLGLASAARLPPPLQTVKRQANPQLSEEFARERRDRDRMRPMHLPALPAPDERAREMLRSVGQMDLRFGW